MNKAVKDKLKAKVQKIKGKSIETDANLKEKAADARIWLNQKIDNLQQKI